MCMSSTKDLLLANTFPLAPEKLNLGIRCINYMKALADIKVGHSGDLNVLCP